MKLGKLVLFILPLLSLNVTAVQANKADGINNGYSVNKNHTAPVVNYDRVSDQLSAVADTSSLKAVLARIAQESGIEVLFDDQADDFISFDIQATSLESGLKHMLKGRNYMMSYSRNAQQELLLTGVTVLPAGEQDSGRAKRLMAIDDEAYYRARSQLSIQQVQKMDMTNERWRARLEEMPAEFRKKIEDKVASRFLEEERRDQLRSEEKKKKLQKIAQLKEKQKKSRETMLEKFSTDERAAFEQSSNESRENVKSMLFSGQN